MPGTGHAKKERRKYCSKRSTKENAQRADEGSDPHLHKKEQACDFRRVGSEYRVARKRCEACDKHLTSPANMKQHSAESGGKKDFF